MWIANIAFERPDAPEGHKWKTFGAIWYDADKHRCSIRLRGFRFGMAVGKPKPEIETPPYLDGDIMYHTGDYAAPANVRRDYLWCGHICTNGDTGTYIVLLGVMPYPRPPSDKERIRQGVFMDVFLSDRDVPAEPQTSHSDDEVPF